MFLLLWVTQVAMTEVSRAYYSWGLWRTDVLNSLELLSALSCILGLIVRLHIRGPRTIDFLRDDYGKLSPSHLFAWALNPTEVPLHF